MPRRMSAQNRDLVMSLVRADPEDLGPQLGFMSMKYGIPASAYAKLLDVSLPTVYAWFYGESKPRAESVKHTKRLLAIMRRALLAHEFPLEGTHIQREHAMIEAVRRHAVSR